MAAGSRLRARLTTSCPIPGLRLALWNKRAGPHQSSTADLVSGPAWEKVVIEPLRSNERNKSHKDHSLGQAFDIGADVEPRSIIIRDHLPSLKIDKALPP